jgi:hypothetical protein
LVCLMNAGIRDSPGLQSMVFQVVQVPFGGLFPFNLFL